MNIRMDQIKDNEGKAFPHCQSSLSGARVPLHTQRSGVMAVPVLIRACWLQIVQST